MTVPVPGSLTYSYDEDGITTVFAYPVRFFEPQELEVVREVGGVRTTLTYNVDYTVSGAGSPSGGAITRTAATDGGKIIITRNTAWKQIVDLEDKQRNPAQAVEDQLDRLTMAGQDARAAIGVLQNKTGDLDDAVARAEAAQEDAEAAAQAAEAAQLAAESAAGANLSNADSVEAAKLTNIPGSVNYIRTAGYAGPGDGGGALYKRAVTEPSHPGKFQSADGAWWELAPANTVHFERGTLSFMKDSYYGNEGFYALHPLLTGAVDTPSKFINAIGISSDQLSTTGKVNGFGIEHVFGGPGTRGGRHGAFFNLTQFNPTEADNTDRNYVGAQTLCHTHSGDGGALGAEKGAYFSASFLAAATDDARYVFNLTGFELNTTINTNNTHGVRLHTGFQIASLINERGYDVDAAMSVSCQAGTHGFKNGILFSSMNGRAPLDADSSIVSVENVPAAGAFLNAPNTTFDRVINTKGVDIRPGRIAADVAGAGIILGSPSDASLLTVDFQSGGAGAAYDTRLYATGGSAADGTGVLGFAASQVITPTVRPDVDNAFSLGEASFRYSQVFAATGTINTSDRDLKENIAPLDLRLAKQMVSEIDAVSFVWKDDEVEAAAETHTVLRQAKRLVTETVETVEVIDGKAVLKKTPVTREEPVFTEHFIYDENGQQVFDLCPVKDLLKDEAGNTVYDAEGRPVWTTSVERKPRIHYEPVMEEVEEVVHSTPAFKKKNVRTHFGFVAQDFSEFLARHGMTTADFAGYVEGEDGRKGLRYEQALVVMWPVLKDLMARIEALEAALTGQE